MRNSLALAPYLSLPPLSLTKLHVVVSVACVKYGVARSAERVVNRILLCVQCVLECFLACVSACPTYLGAWLQTKVQG